MRRCLRRNARAGILVGNYGEAGALDLYGPAHGLPRPISGGNSLWARGYGNPPPETVILVDFERAYADRLFQSCRPASQVKNRYGVRNEESVHPQHALCLRGAMAILVPTLARHAVVPVRLLRTRLQHLHCVKSRSWEQSSAHDQGVTLPFPTAPRPPRLLDHSPSDAGHTHFHEATYR